MIPVGNRTAFLANALASLVNQDLDPAMTQIEVVDDSDRAEDIASIIAGFPELQINHFRQPSRVSMAANFNTCAERAQNDLVHILHDDDRVLPGFYAKYHEYARRYPDVGLIAGRSKVVRSDGRLIRTTPFYQELASPSTNEEPFYYYADIPFPAVVLRKSCYASCGGFDARLTYMVDREMWIRAIRFCGGVMHNDVLACWTVHGKSTTSAFKEQGADAEEAMRFAEIVKKFSPNISKEVLGRLYRAALIRRMVKHTLHGSFRALPRLASVFRSLPGKTHLTADIWRATAEKVRWWSRKHFQ
jgi:glycosyltransferase involved in cell wall biosynthesis